MTSEVGSICAWRIIAALAAILTVGCTPPRSSSEIARTVGEASFEVPPTLTTADAPGAAAVRGPQELGTIGATIVPGRAPVATALPGSVSLGTGGVQVAFEDADLREVVREILGNILRLPYAIQDGVNGRVSLSTAGPIPERDLLHLLETVLRMNGAALVEGPAGWQVVTLEEARGRPQVQPLIGADLRPAPGTGVTLVPLRYASAAAAAQLIQPLLSRPEEIRIDEGRNLVLFAGDGLERRNVVELLSAIDTDWLAGRSIGIFPLTIATPETIIAELEAIALSEVQPVDGRSAIRFVPVTRLNAVLAVGGSAEQIRDIQEWVRRLDRGRDAGPQFFVYELKHAPAEEVARVLGQAFALSDTDPLLQPAALPAGAGVPGLGQTGLVGEFDIAGSPLPTAVATTPGDGQARPQPGVRVIPNPRTNSVVVRATAKEWETIEATIRRLDIAPAQVLIEATIAEVVLNDALRYGVQYFINAGSFRFGFNTTGQGLVNPNNLEPLAQLPGFNFVYTGGSSNITIDALARVTDVRVLSSPSVVVQDNSEAVLSVGDSVPVSTRTAQSVADPDAPLLAQIEYRDTGVILQVRPRINSNGIVSLEVGQEVSRVIDTGTTGQLQLQPTPTIQQRRITSRINVLSGQTVVLGGLIQEDERRSRDRIPILGDLPLLGPLFGSTSTSTGRTELIVFLTPRVIRNPADARDVSQELRDRMRALRASELGTTTFGLPAPAQPEAPPPEPPRGLVPPPEPRPLRPPPTS